jgi:hypothetical protein
MLTLRWLVMATLNNQIKEMRCWHIAAPELLKLAEPRRPLRGGKGQKSPLKSSPCSGLIKPDTNM